MIAAARRLLSLGVLVAATGAMLAIVAPGVTDAPTATASACVWDDELNDTIRELGSNRAVWSVVPAAEIDPYGGYVEYDYGTVRIADDLPCDTVADIVRHEWMHVQQVRKHGGRDGIDAAYGERHEIVADCGSWLLGSTHTPYIDRADADRGVGCTARDLADARALIGYPSFADQSRGDDR